MKRFINPEVMDVGFGFSESGIYKTLEPSGVEAYRTYINELPFVPEPEAFGLHDNAEITTN